MMGDGIEIWPIKKYLNFSEQCESTEADYWSVFIHITGYGIDCVADFVEERMAYEFAKSLIARYDNLKKYAFS